MTPIFEDSRREWFIVIGRDRPRLVWFLKHDWPTDLTQCSPSLLGSLQVAYRNRRNEWLELADTAPFGSADCKACIEQAAKYDRAFYDIKDEWERRYEEFERHYPERYGT